MAEVTFLSFRPKRSGVEKSHKYKFDYENK